MKELHEEFVELVKTTDEEVKKAQSKSSTLNTLSGHIVPKIEALVTKVLTLEDLNSGMSDIVVSLLQIKKDIEVAQYAEQVQVAFRLGQQLVAQATASKTEEILKAEDEKQRTEELKEKISAGEVDPEAHRRPGQRPESLRNIRNAQKLIEESKSSEEVSNEKPKKSSGKFKKKSNT